MSKQTSPSQFLWLIELSLELLPNLKSLQGLVELPSMKNLTLTGMPNLEELWITSCLETGQGEVGVQYCFPMLTNLAVKLCPKLYVKPYLPPCLEKLTVERSNEHLLSSSSLFSCPLKPDVDKSSSSFSALGVVPCLKELRLDGVMVSSPVWEVLQHFSGLEFLGIHGCPDMRQLPTSIGSLTSLRQLQITRCSSLCMLPEGLQHLTSIQHLELAECDALTMMPEWIGQLSVLQSLRISECPALESLPQSIKCLTALQELFIFGCRGLTKRYEEEVGDDQNLIFHIPSVTIVDLELLARRLGACTSVNP